MENNLKNILLSEVYSASTYIERLFHAMIEMSSLGVLPEGQSLAAKLHFDLSELFEQNLLLAKFTNTTSKYHTVKEVRDLCTQAQNLLQALLKLGLDEASVVEFSVKYINVTYTHAYELHKLVTDYTDLDVQLPRVNLVQVNNEFNEDADTPVENAVPSFFLNLADVQKYGEMEIGAVSSLDWQRDKKCQELIQEGHEAIFNKEHDKALEKFTKALNYKETAEILTLVGWVHSLKENNEKAKTYCLKAIQKDPDYGPPYNDLGSLLLAEGQIEESLKWFDLAKKATNYQNREYPYINAGRAYMTKKNLTKALEEFSKALTLAPFHDELHHTVEKLKQSIHKASVDVTFLKDHIGDLDEDPGDLPPSIF